MHAAHKNMFALEKENTIFKLTCSLIPIIFQFYMENNEYNQCNDGKMLIKSAVEIKSIMIENE